MKELLVAIHEYYPIGIPEIYREYDGFHKLKKIILEKIGKNEQYNTYTVLVNNLRELFFPNELNDYSYFEFPSYFLTIDLEETDLNGIKLKVRAIIVISLLANLYTVYFSNTYSFIDDDFFSSKNHQSYEIIYFNDCKNKGLREISNKVKREVEQRFKEHKFIHHFVLFDNEVKGGRTLLDLDNDFPNQNYTYYDYLFSIDKVLKSDFKVLP
jgi:hypothetical protein